MPPGLPIMEHNNNDESNNNNNNQKKPPPPSDMEAKARARMEARASRPGAVSVAADEAARLDQRIADKEQGAVPKSLNRLEQDVQAKQAAVGGSSAPQKPGAFAVTKSPPPKGGVVPASLNSLEDQIAAKTQRAPVGAQAALSSLEDRIQAKVQGDTAAHRKPPPPAAAAPGAVMSMEERIQAKIRRDNNNHHSSSGRSQLQTLEDRVNAKQHEYTRGVRPEQEANRLDERIAAKNSATSNLKAPPPSSVASVVEPASSSLKKAPDSGVASKKVEEYEGTEKGDDYAGTDPLAHGGSDLEYGVYDAAENPEGLAVAVPVMEEDEDVFIPSAVEYDPDAKPPIYRNRRFRLYGFLAFFVLVMVAVGAGVGIRLSQSDEYDPTKAFAHRENLGIRETVERVVGTEVLEDENSPFSRALRWIMYQDPMELVPEMPNFVQRYILAYFYYATSVEKPWLSCNPPKEDEPDSCFWDKIQWLNPLTRVEVASFRWLGGANECYWAGVLCDEFNQTRSLDLFGANLTGSFPVGVVHLPYLQSLSIIYSELSGPLPKEVANMKHLVNIELHENSFTGEIPQEWWESRSLQRINVGSNQLSGPIPKSVQNMRDAKGLYLYNNLLTGSIPTEVGLLNSVSFFRVNRNFLDGEIPSEMGHIRSLVSLWLHNNNLSGSIPTDLGRIPKLREVRASTNPRLTGELPDGVIDFLQHLDVSNCNMSGDLSTKWPLMKRMQLLRLQNNNFSGPLPENLGAIMPDIATMQLSGNSFTGSVPDSICDMAGRFVLTELVADCAAPFGQDPEIFCPEGCCSECCDANGENCRADGDAD